MSESEVQVSQESTKSAERQRNDSESEFSPEVDFKPIIELPLVDIKTLEEDEEELLKLRGRLYRFETVEEVAEWKERGTGEIKILKHKENGSTRLLMRRDKTLKICANHYIKSTMELNKHSNNEKAWVWSAVDFADEEARPELLCIRFGNVENAQKFQNAFEEAKRLAKDYEEKSDLSRQLSDVKLSTNGDKEGSEADDEEDESDESQNSENEAKDK